MDVVLSLLRSIISALVGIFVALGSIFTPHVSAINPNPAPTQTVIVASSTEPLSQKSSDLLSEPSVSREGSAGQTFVPKALSPSEPTKSVRVTTSATSTLPKQTPAPTPSLPTEDINALARASLVNILCTTQSGGYFNPISGSGVMVDSRGIILTNAHVAQYLLLHDYPTPGNIQCVVRTGSPAAPRYTAEVLYLPPKWIAANASQIASSTPTGTGQNDFAFLYITGTTNPAIALPSSFPALAMDGADPDEKQQMVLVAYPAGFLGGISITLNLYITSAVAHVGSVYSFDGTNVDLFSLGGTVVSQSGSSGGAAVNGQGKLQGIIATEVPADTTAGRDLRAITVGHINRSLIADGQGGVLGLLSNDPASFAAAFNAKIAPIETQALTRALDGQ